MLKKRLITLALIFVFIFGCIGPISVSADEFFKTDEYIEAEEGLLRNNIYKISSAYASGGKYIVSKSASLNSEEEIKTEEFSFLFDVEAEAEYKVYMRIHIPSTNANQIFWRWNNDAWQTFKGVAENDFYWAEIGSQRLKAGINKLQFCHKSTDVYYDIIHVTKDAAFVPKEPEGVEKMPEVKAPVEEFAQTQKQECIVKADSEGVMFEAENASLQSGISTSSANEGLSGGTAVYCSGGVEDRSVPLPEAVGWIEFVFTPEEAGQYNVWARTMCVSEGEDSWYVSVGPENERTEYLSQAPVLNETGYTWTSIRFSVEAEAEQRIKVRIRPRESGWRIDQFVITDQKTYIPSGIENEIKFKNPIMYPTGGVYPPFNPPAGEHPRLLFREADIPTIKANIDHPINAQVKEMFFSYAKEDVDLGTVANDAARTRIEAKALYYALYGDEEIGKEAVELSQEALEWEMNKRSDGQERAYEFVLTMQSRVYDWCYDLMTPEQRENVYNVGVSYCAQTETGWPPMQESLQGHGAESVLLRGMLSFAIATYDERPDYWDCVAGRFYADYVEEREWHQASLMHHQGTSYGNYRHLWSCWAAKIITAMGAEAPYNLENAGKHAYSLFTYPRRPDGSLFKWGDNNYSSPMKYSAHYEGLLLMHSVGKDPYVTDELMRCVLNGSKDGISYNVSEPVPWLLLFDPNVEPKSITNLPNSYYFGAPMGVTFARTGWEEGIDSNSVAAVMFVNEYEFGNHQHKDRGSFQLWYRGPLASEGGIYDNYGTENHKVWTYQSTAHNCLIVYDPDEPAENFGNGVNDGGQYGVMYGTTWDQIQADPEKDRRARVVGQEIDPENPIKPYYTYLKGDLKKAYSDKISEYTRSFMFLDLKEENVPAALIVFDRVTTPDEKLEKRWLLHGQSEPKITGARSVWNTLPYEDDLGRKYTGKMVVDSLLPADNKVETEVLGSEEEGWWTINGVSYPHPNSDPLSEDNTYRMEKRISGENTTYFLNCLQVTDESNPSVYNTKLIDTNEFYGLEISDRIVMFSKSGQRVSSSFELKGQSGGSKSLRYTVCDVEKGKWNVITDDGEQTVYVSEEGGVLAFEAKGLSIRAEKIDDSQKEEAQVVEYGDKNLITVKMAGTNGSFVGFKEEPKMVDGKLMVAASGLASALGLKTEKVFLGESFTDEKQKITLTFKPGSKVFIKNGVSETTVNSAYYEGDELMVELRPFAEGFNYVVQWDEIYQRAFLAEDKPVVLVNLPGYAKIASLKNDDDNRVAKTDGAPNASDGLLTTIWSAEGKDRYIQIELEKEEIIGSAEIVFNPNGERTPKFEIQLSLDGENYETVYDGVGFSGTDGLTWESFTLDVTKPNKAKYIRYFAKGSDISDWNAIREIRFKIGEELVTWSDSDVYAKISSVRMDDGEVDGDNVGENLIDNNSRTLWASFGVGRYVDLVLEETASVSGVDIVFNPNGNRTAKFEIAVSENGEDFVTVYSGKSNPNAENNAKEHFEFDKAYNAKYVRYIANGSDISQWNGVKEMRVIKE